MDIHREPLEAAVPGGGSADGLDTPSELAAHLTMLRRELAPQVPRAEWQSAYVRAGRYLAALGHEPGRHETLLRDALTDAAADEPDCFVAATLDALRARLNKRAAPDIAVAPLPPMMPAIARSHMRPQIMRRRQLRDLWTRRLAPVLALAVRSCESLYRTLRLMAS